MIDSMTVWHGPVHGIYGAAARAELEGLPITVVDCQESCPNSAIALLPEDDLLAEDHNGLLIRGMHHWKAEELAQLGKHLKGHALNWRVAATSDKPPVKSMASLAGKVYDYSIPKQAKPYASQIENWLLTQQRSLAPGVAATLVDYCSPDPAVAQQVAVALAASPGGRPLEWADVEPIVSELVREQKPMWELGRAIATGSSVDVVDTLRTIDVDQPFVIMRFLENRYRMMMLVVDRADLEDIQAISPKTTDWVLRKARDEARGMTPTMCSLAMDDIRNATALMLDSPTTLGMTIVEQCALKLAARHRRARR